MRIDEPRRPSGPSHAIAPQYGPRRTGSSALDQLHRPDLGRAGDRAAGERGREQVERVAGPGRSRPVTVVTRCWTAAVRSSRSSRGTRTRARLADPAEVVAQDVDDHHVLGLVLGAGEELAGQCPVLVPRPAPRARALDRVRADTFPSPSTERNGSGEADSSARGAPVAGDGAEVQVAREQRRDRRSAAGGTAATGRRGTAPRAGGSGSPGRSRPARWPRGPPRRSRSTSRCEVPLRNATERGLDDGPASGTGRGSGRYPPRNAATRACTSSRAAGARSPRPRRPPATPSHASPVRRSHAIAQSWSARRISGRCWSTRASRRQPLEPPAEVVRAGTPRARRRTAGRAAPAPGTAPASTRRSSARASANGSGPSAGASRTATGSAAR